MNTNRGFWLRLACLECSMEVYKNLAEFDCIITAAKSLSLELAEQHQPGCMYRNQPDFAEKQKASNELQYKTALDKKLNDLSRLYNGEMWEEKKPEPEPEQPKNKRGYEWL